MSMDELFGVDLVQEQATKIENEYAGRELYAESKNGKVQMWKADVLDEQTKEGWMIIRATFGFTDGAKQTKDTHVKAGKNIGKKNETTIVEQAYIKLSQMYQDRIKKNAMVWDIKDWITPKRPMLATTWKKRAKFLTKVRGWLIDKKLNGNRAYTYSDGSIQSKSGEPITPFKHLREEHEKTFGKGHHKYGPIDIDGEFYIHGTRLEDLTGLINTENDDERPTDLLMQYHVYDCYFPEHPELTALQRYEALQDLFVDSILEYHFLSEKQLIENKWEVIEKLALEYVEQGYEGGMLRDIDGVYMHSKNTSDRNDVLIKVKFMEDDEFFILEIIENDNEPGIPKFIVDLRNEQTCEVVMSGEKDAARKYWTNRNDYIMKAWLKVQYQEWTKYGKLSFPVGIEIREGKLDADGKFDPKY